MCPLRVTKLEVLEPIRSPFTMDIQYKHLFLEFSSDPFAMCMMAFGPHRGGVNFDISEYAGLPALHGLYILNINGENYGVLNITKENGAVLTPNIEE